MIIKHRVFQPEEGFFFNQPGTDAPTVANPQTVGPVINQRLGVDLLPVIAIAGTSLPVDLGEVASWAPRNRFLNKTIVVAQDVSEQFEDVDEFYAQNFTTGLFQIPRIFTRGLQSAADSVALGTDIDESTSEANAPNIVLEAIKTIPTSLELSTNVAVHDRLGKLFYSVDVPDNDLFTQRIQGTSFFPDWNYTSYSAYVNIDQTLSVEQPPNEQNGPQGELTNTTRPLFSPMVAVQNITIPGEEEGS